MFLKKETIYSYQAGVLYRDGVFQRVLGPGRYTFPHKDKLQVVDLRERQQIVGGQEILSADQLPVRISSIVVYRVVEPRAFVEHSEYPESDIHSALQLALREVVAQMKFDECLTDTAKIVSGCQESVAAAALKVGVELVQIAIRDVMMPSQLKKAALAVTIAQKEAQASLEKARGEAASMRCLLNAANLIKEHPELLQLRTLQALETGKSGSAIIDFTKKA